MVLTSGDSNHGPAVVVTPDGRFAALAVCRPDGAFRMTLADGCHPVKFRVNGHDVLAWNGEAIAAIKQRKRVREISFSGRCFSYGVDRADPGYSMSARDLETGDILVGRESLPPWRLAYGNRSFAVETSDGNLALVDGDRGVVLEVHDSEVTASSELDGPYLPLLVAVANLSRLQ